MPAIATSPMKTKAIRANELVEPASSSRKIMKFFAELIKEARSTSRFLQIEKQYRDLGAALETYANLEDNWDSYGADKPSPSAIKATAEFMEKVRAEPFVPDRIIPSAEGGIAIYFTKGPKTAYVEYRNSGGVILAMYDDKNDPLIVELAKNDADEYRALRLIRNYVTS